MRAYILLRTKDGTSKNIIDKIQKMDDGRYLGGNVVYGWYDVITEHEVGNATKLNELIKELKRKCPGITHITTAIERKSETPPALFFG